jgi:hypothetical protein
MDNGARRSRSETHGTFWKFPVTSSFPVPDTDEGCLKPQALPPAALGVLSNHNKSSALTGNEQEWPSLGMLGQSSA